MLAKKEKKKKLLKLFPIEYICVTQHSHEPCYKETGKKKKKPKVPRLYHVSHALAPISRPNSGYCKFLQKYAVAVSSCIVVRSYVADQRNYASYLNSCLSALFKKKDWLKSVRENRG